MRIQDPSPHTHWQWRVVYNIYRHKHNRSSWSRPQAVGPPTEPHTVKSIGKREANTVIFTYILGVFQSHQELHFWHRSFHFEDQSGTKRESVIIWHFNGWGHHSSSLCPPSDATWCLTRSAHLHYPQNNSGFEAHSGGLVVNSSNWPRTRMQRVIFDRSIYCRMEGLKRGHNCGRTASGDRLTGFLYMTNETFWLISYWGPRPSLWKKKKKKKSTSLDVFESVWVEWVFESSC